MSITHADRCFLPHAVYWIYNRKMELLYVGCSYNLFSRITGHRNKPWAREIAAIKVQWFDNELLGRRAEARIILEHTPKYNLRVLHPDVIGTDEMNRHARKPRGDGLHCPRCRNPKERRAAAYCNACYNIYKRRLVMERLAKKND